MPERTPRQEYESRLRLREVELARLGRWDRWLGNSRVTVFALAARRGLADADQPDLESVVARSGEPRIRRPGGGARPDRRGSPPRRARSRLLSAGDWLAWAGDGTDPLDDGARFRDDEHPYAVDLDLFGPGSLYALLCTAHSLPGREALAAWLSSSAEPAEIDGRQAAA